MHPVLVAEARATPRRVGHEGESQVYLCAFTCTHRPECNIELTLFALCAVRLRIPLSSTSAGLKDGEAVPDAAAPFLRDIVAGAFPEASPAAVEAAVSGRVNRAVAYS